MYSVFKGKGCNGRISSLAKLSLICEANKRRFSYKRNFKDKQSPTHLGNKQHKGIFRMRQKSELTI